MFHEATPLLRAWLAAFAGERPELHDQLEGELGRLRSALAGSEADREARLALIHELRGHLADRESDIFGLRDRLAERSVEINALRTTLAERERQLAARESALATCRAESAALAASLDRRDAEFGEARAELARRDDGAAGAVGALPGLGWRTPGGRTVADRLKRLKSRLFGP